jgi:murein L,D-transpeptidase YcbB/YkuD
VLLTVLTVACRGEKGKTGAIPNGLGSTTSQDIEQQLHTNEGRGELRAILGAAELPGLRWPSFKDYRIQVKEFYDSFDDTLAWVHSSKPTRQARTMIQLMKGADLKGLAPEDYDGPQWNERLAGLDQPTPSSESELVRFDVALTVSVMRYVSDLHMGRVNPRLFHFGLDIDHKKFALSEFLRNNLVNAQNVSATMDKVEPPFPAYRRTITALDSYLDLAHRDDGALLPDLKKTVKPGDHYPGVPRLIRLLELVGDLPRGTSKTFETNTYDGILVEAVKHFQQRHGLAPDGGIGSQTLKELNTPLARRITQLRLTLERWRWLPHAFERPPIIVNIPEFRLYAADNEKEVAFSMKVVVGKAYQHKTPVFASQIKSVIFRPYWNVPLGIQQQELLPHIEKDPSYLSENSYEVVDSSGKIITDGAVNDEIMEKLRSGTLAIRQRPGPKNALGLVKFELPNQFDIYMHGTPAIQLFSRPRRDFSHGCIRVEDPVSLAAWVLRDEPEWTEEKIRTAMNGDETIRANLKKPIPVLILYGTANVTEDGEVRFSDDIYGYDADLERALAKNHSEP